MWKLVINLKSWSLICIKFPISINQSLRKIKYDGRRNAKNLDVCIPGYQCKPVQTRQRVLQDNSLWFTGWGTSWQGWEQTRILPTVWSVRSKACLQVSCSIFILIDKVEIYVNVQCKCLNLRLVMVVAGYYPFSHNLTGIQFLFFILALNLYMGFLSKYRIIV